jgi:hypothetical protein
MQDLVSGSQISPRRHGGAGSAVVIARRVMRGRRRVVRRRCIFSALM